MSYVKRIVCLANSYKTLDGRCIAGVEALEDGKFGGWIRVVSGRSAGQLSYSECAYLNGQLAKPLDILQVPLLKAVPNRPHIENHLLDPTAPLVKQGELEWKELDRIRQRPESIWGDSETAVLENSLLLLRKKIFLLEVGVGMMEGRMQRTYRGKFDYRGVNYNLHLNDPAARQAFALNSEGDYRFTDVYLCLSLTEPSKRDARCEKMVASVLTDPPL